MAFSAAKVAATSETDGWLSSSEQAEGTRVSGLDTVIEIVSMHGEGLTCHSPFVKALENSGGEHDALVIALPKTEVGTYELGANDVVAYRSRFPAVESQAIEDGSLAIVARGEASLTVTLHRVGDVLAGTYTVPICP